jgi:hypothetical protein
MSWPVIWHYRLELIQGNQKEISVCEAVSRWRYEPGNTRIRKPDYSLLGSTPRDMFYIPLTLSFSKIEYYTYPITHQSTNFHPEDGGSMYLRNVGSITHNHTV